jgi:predicted alpha/beta superfamily hydrolase
MSEWKDYAWPAEGPGREGPGHIRVLPGVWSPQLENRRDLLVHVPAGYDGGNARYPVLYMQDGQNLFDAATSFAGEWGVDRALHTLGAEGKEAIIVGIPNTGPGRIDEYSPFVDAKRGGGRGDAYLDFVLETVRPLIDAEFRTAADRHSTGIFGSSMGGLISLYAFFKRPDAFGFAGAMSPSLWFADRALFRFIEDSPFVPGKLYIDAGTLEGPALLMDVARLRELLIGKGYKRGRDLLSIVEKGGRHHEFAWGGRFAKALRFLMRGAHVPRR